jgi:hypothetical protein
MAGFDLNIQEQKGFSISIRCTILFENVKSVIQNIINLTERTKFVSLISERSVVSHTILEY